MINQSRIKNIEEALKENDITAFSDHSLIRVLSMLTLEELDFFVDNSVNTFDNDAYNRLNRLRPRIKYEINKYIHNIEISDMYANFLNAVKNNKIKEYVISLSRDDLGELKKVLTIKNNYANDSGLGELLKFITNEIIKKDELNLDGTY